MDETLLGIDIGTGSSKAVLASPDGTVIASTQRPHDVAMPRSGWFEHDAESVWWADIRSMCAELPIDDRLAGICVSGIGPCLLPCDIDLRPLRPAILYGVDTRAAEQIDELNRRYGQDTLFARSGSRLSSQAVGPKLLWLQRHEPDVWARTAGWFMPGSFAVARLTGEYILDHHSASQCDPLYDLAAGDWAYDLADEVAPGVPLPRLVWPGEIVGNVSSRGAAASGLPIGMPVLAGTIDAWAEAFSVGVRRPGDVMLMYGSTMFIIAVLERPITHPKLWATAGVEAGTHCLAAGMATSGALIEWLRRLTGGVALETLVGEAAATPPGSHGLLILPYFAGERSPIFDSDARGVITGLTLEHSRGHLTRAIYEAVAFGVRHNLQEMTQAIGEPQRIVAVGGGTKASLWTQIVSDVCAIEQVMPAQTIGASYGDAHLAAIATGLTEAHDDWMTPASMVQPNVAHRDLYRDLYGLYRRLYDQTVETSHRLASLQRGDRPASL